MLILQYSYHLKYGQSYNKKEKPKKENKTKNSKNKKQSKQRVKKVKPDELVVKGINS